MEKIMRYLYYILGVLVAIAVLTYRDYVIAYLGSGKVLFLLFLLVLGILWVYQDKIKRFFKNLSDRVDR